jgi:hypothetical protein
VQLAFSLREQTLNELLPAFYFHQHDPNG